MVVAALAMSCTANRTAPNHGSTGPGVGNVSELREAIADYCRGKDARIGMAAIIGTDTVAYNGNRDFPMLSVFKFPVALAYAEKLDRSGLSLADSISFGVNAMRQDTYSPMLQKYGFRPLSLTYKELMGWLLMESDNNACDIMIGFIGGIDSLSSSYSRIAVPQGITIGATEADMHADVYRCYLNRSTPVAMAALFQRFNQSLRHRSNSFSTIAVMLEGCLTGPNRIVRYLDGQGVVAGHKTGTGGLNTQGRIMAVNDAGYVLLPDGRSYSIAIFVADSAYDMAASEEIIAHISRLVYSYAKKKR